MRIVVNGIETFVGTGGRAFDPALPCIVFLHGAGLDHSVWALLARSFAHHGFGVLAPDFPGHGRSAGAPLSSIAALAEWTAALIAAAGVPADRRLLAVIAHLVWLATLIGALIGTTFAPLSWSQPLDRGRASRPSVN